MRSITAQSERTVSYDPLLYSERSGHAPVESDILKGVEPEHVVHIENADRDAKVAMYRFVARAAPSASEKKRLGDLIGPVQSRMLIKRDGELFWRFSARSVDELASAVGALIEEDVDVSVQRKTPATRGRAIRRKGTFGAYQGMILGALGLASVGATALSSDIRN